MNEETHIHNGIDSLKLYPQDQHGFPIFEGIPDYKDEEGKFTIALSGGFKYLYAMIDRVWTRMATASTFLTNTATLNFGAIGPHSAADLTMALTGAVIGDTITLGVDDAVISGGVDCTNITFFAWVSAPDVVTIRCLNNDSVNTANPASGSFKVTTIQF